MITVSINNSQEILETGSTVLNAIEVLGYESNYMIGVALNQHFVPKDQWNKTLLNSNDKVDILNPVSGG